MPTTPLNLAVLVSGGGTTLQNLIDEIAAGKIAAKISLVIASKPGIKGIERAEKAGIATFLAPRSSFESLEAFSEYIFALCAQHKVDLICLAGWLQLLRLPDEWLGKVMNIHPALLPGFGGKGMFGHRVHEAVIAAGSKVSGCTVHFVDNEYDAGPIILQRVCPVLDGDTADTLAARVFEEEKTAYPQAIEMFRNNRLKIEGRRVVIAS
jgi:formyltetrahydrofolate-dependent phosphoribosylglycinamide formyltransferase